MCKKLVAGLVAGALVLAACGDDSADEPAAESAELSEESGETSPATSDDSRATTGEATTGEATSGEATTDDATTGATTEEVPSDAIPSAIISLSPAATEMLYAIGAGDQVLAVDDFSNFPSEAADKMQGLSGFEPNVEAIAGLEPDLVVTDGTNGDLLAQLDSLDIAHWEGPAAVAFDDVYAQIEQLGVATGHVDEATELVAGMQADVEAVKAGLPELSEPLTYYHELEPESYFSVTSDTFIGAVYAEIGLVNIADAVGDGNPYPQLNAEFIIEQDPDLIFLACTIYCGATAQSVGDRPGWESMTAVTTGGVIEMDDDIASRWGPRIVEYLQVAGEAVATVAAAQG